MEISREEKKEKGIFYTPQFLANYVARKALEYSSQPYSILDPACGDGELIAAIRDSNPNNSMYFGFDCERLAINAVTERFQDSFLGLKVDSIFPYKNPDHKIGWTRLKKTCNIKDGFDLIISNPPWGSDLSHYDKAQIKEQFSSGEGQFNSFDLFVELIIEQLAVNGTYAIIVPDTIFFQEHTHIRELLLKNTSIKLIARLGEGIFPGINIATAVFIGKKDSNYPTNIVRTFKITSSIKKSILQDTISLDEVERLYATDIPQSRFITNTNFNIDIDVTGNDENLIAKLNSYERLSKWIRINRGAEISKKGTINQCPLCKKWFSVPRKETYKCPHCGARGSKSNIISKIIVSSNPTESSVPLLTGSNFFRYTTKIDKWLTPGYDGIKYKKESLYKGPKILIRKTGLGITSCLDYSNSHTIQCVYIVNIKKGYQLSIPIELISMILNSRAITYYLLKSHGETEWKTHPYLTQEMIKEIPIPDASRIRLFSTEIITLSEQLSSFCKSSTSPNIPYALDKQIEKLVADLFMLTENDYSLIMSTIGSAQQLIPIKRINNCSPRDLFENGI